MGKASINDFDVSIYKSDFMLIVEHVMRHFYEIMVHRNYTPGQLETEDQIRNALLDILKDKNVRLTNEYIFNAECPIVDSNYRSIGYVDLFVTNVKHYLERKDEDYIIECKRLDGGISLNRLYLKEGIMRFVEGKYVTKHKSYGMIGFLVAKKFDAEENIKKINRLVQEERIPVEFKREIHKHAKNNNGQIYLSTHKGGKDIYHLMFSVKDIA